MLDAHTEAELFGQHGVMLIEENRREPRSYACHNEVLRRSDEFIVFRRKSGWGYLLEIEGELLRCFLGRHLRTGKSVRRLGRLRLQLQLIDLIDLRPELAFHRDLFVMLSESGDGHNGQDDYSDNSFHDLFHF